MTKHPLTVSAERARCLAVTAQRLAGSPPSASPRSLMDVMRQIRCVQVDPTNVVARTQHLVLFARLGNRYTPAHLDEVAWRRKELFSYWAHAASFVLTDDFPIHAFRMRRWPEGETAYAIRARKWIQENATMRRHILWRIRKEGPLRARDFTVTDAIPWRSGGWNSGQDVARMLEFLWIKGKVMVAGRKGVDRLWDLADRWFPPWTPQERLTKRQVVRAAALHSLRALGVATERHIAQHFIRSAYPGLTAVLAELEGAGEIVPVVVEGLPGRWFTTAEDAEKLQRADAEWEPRTTLLSPFDNLVADRVRTRELFDFDFSLEIYVPKAKRRFGYYVLPILHGDRFIGRIDSKMDRDGNVYVVNNVYVEKNAPRDRSTGAAVKAAIEGLAKWLGASSIRYGAVEGWRSALR